MDDLVDHVNRMLGVENPLSVSAYVLWKLNYIHPFINGNGRTARAACYFILCVCAGGWLKSKTILPVLLKRDNTDYIDALKKVDKTASKDESNIDLTPLENLIVRLLSEQLSI